MTCGLACLTAAVYDFTGLVIAAAAAAIIISLKIITTLKRMQPFSCAWLYSCIWYRFRDIAGYYYYYYKSYSKYVFT